MNIKYKTYEDFGNILADDVLDKLTGVHHNFVRSSFDGYPSNNILIGTINGLVDTEDDEQSNNFLFPNSITTKFLVEDFTSDITVDLKFHVFYRVYPTYEEQKAFAEKRDNQRVRFYPMWKRMEIKHSVILNKDSKNEISISDCFSDYIKTIKDDNDLLRKNTQFDVKILESEEEYNSFLSQEKNREFPYLNWNASLRFDYEEYIQDQEKSFIVTISLINETILPSQEDEGKTGFSFDPSFINPILEISLGNNIFKKFRYFNPNSEEKYFFADLRCLNCQGEYDEDLNKIITKNYGDIDKKKEAPINKLDGIDISFKTLSTESGIGELEKIYQAMNEFLDNSSEDNPHFNDFLLMKERFNENISLLKRDEKIAKAFYLMNETFRRNSKDSSYDSWRLFQIVFIVSQIKDIALEKERDTCELLHVMTGGGKSETYFGVIIFTAFYDRLRGKAFGVSGVTKFPLRMLSVQQLQRISNIFIFAEQVRRELDIGEEFSIAYFVGSQDEDFPPSNVFIYMDILEKKETNEKVPGRIINQCPLCHGEVNLDVDETQRLVIHKCDKCGEEFRLYFSDDEVYRTLPTFIVSTVDKWAGIASNRRYRNLLGGKIDKCPKNHGFIPHNDSCPVLKNTRKDVCKEFGDLYEVGFNTSPTLIIQDEIHLIRESFGTIDSHFETLIETLAMELSGGPKFKNIVMTATVSGAENQIEHLYNKKTRIFPPSLKDLDGESFFFTTLKEKTEDGKDREIVQRRIIGLKSNIQNFKLIFNILRHISEFFTETEKDLESFAAENGFDLDELKEVIMFYKSLLTYHNKKEAVHSISYSIDSYVNLYEDIYEVKTTPLTGENSLDDIKDIISTVDTFYDDEENKRKIFAVNSTNIVSHGVDIDKWNCMVFDGMPRSTSEYIQALSRVGRKYFGIVFVSFSPMRTRDLSFFQHFYEYHDMLESKVENVPISRWVKLGFQQTFTSVFNAAILNYLSNELDRPLHKSPKALQALNNRNNKKKLIDFIKKAYVVGSGMKGSDYFDEQIEYEVDIRIQKLEDENADKFFPHLLQKGPNRYFKTQYGMRGIQDEINLVLKDYSKSNNRGQK